MFYTYGKSSADELNNLQNVITPVAVNHILNIARSEQSSHNITPPGGSHQRLYNFQRKDKIKDFIIINQVVSNVRCVIKE